MLWFVILGFHCKTQKITLMFHWSKERIDKLLISSTVTGKWYEFNSKTGARRWKDTNTLPQEEAKDQIAQVTTSSTSKNQVHLRMLRLVPQKWKDQTARRQNLQKTWDFWPKMATWNYRSPKKSLLGKGSPLPISLRGSPIPSPKSHQNPY